VFSQEDGFRISLGRPPTSALTQETTQEATETTQETTEETTVEATRERSAAPLLAGKTRERILALMRQQPTITTRDLAEALQLSVDGISYHLKKLRGEGRIQHRGPTKSGWWEVIS
jgi:ATP-dependent DNA helicase RecG